MQTKPNIPVLKKPLVLIGLMGCGKSAAGKRVAEALSVPFVDSDAQIVEQAGMPISEIFETKGEAHFRELERETLRKLMEDTHPKVIATGGGAFLNEETQKLILENSISLWLSAELDVLLERVSRKNTRPLLEKGDKATILKELMEVRYPIYAKAVLRVESKDVPHEETVRDILEAIERF